MGRPHIEFIQAFDVAEEAIDDGPFSGARKRVLSTDDETGAWTSVVSFPAGWSGELDGFDRPVEIFGLSGGLSVEGNAVGPSIYAFIPSSKGPMVAATEQTLALVMADEEGASAGGDVDIVDPSPMAWAAIGEGQGTPAGIVYKPLRIDPERGDWSYMVACAPYWQAEQAEVHPTVQEGFTIRGDALLGECGGMEPGSYFWRPPNVKHGPLFTHDGSLFFFRTKGGTWEVKYYDVPGWETMVDAYKAREPFFPRA